MRRRSRCARQLVGDKGIVAPWIQGAFNEVAYLMRGHAVLVDPLDDEGFYRALICYFLDRNLEKVRQFVAAGAEFLSVGGNEANGADGRAGILPPLRLGV